MIANSSLNIESALKIQRGNLRLVNSLDEALTAEEWSDGLLLIGTVRIISFRLAGNYRS